MSFPNREIREMRERLKHKKVCVYLIISMFLVFPITVIGRPVTQSVATVSVSPQKIVGPPPDVGGTFKIYINIENVIDLAGYSIGMKWNPTVLECTAFDYNTTFITGLTVAGAINNTAGEVYPPYALVSTTGGVNGSGTLLQASFLVKAYGESLLNLTVEGLTDFDENSIPFNTVNGTFKLSLPYGPTAAKTHTPSSPQVNEPVTFDASGSLPGWNGTHDVPIATYRWDFGDGNTTTVATPIIYHAYTAADTFTVNLTVTCKDDPVLIAQGLTSASVSQDITVYSAPAPPKAKFTYSPPSPRVNSIVTFDASTSLAGFNGTHDVPIANYTWDFGDGNTTIVTDPSIYHAYSAEGTYTVNLTVTCQDDPVLIAQGLTSNSTGQEITVYEATPPIIGTPTQNPGPTEVTPDQAVTVSVNVTDNVAVQNVILSYSNDTGATWENVTMSLTTGDTYEGGIPGFPAATTVWYKIIAYDTSNNVAVEDNAGEYYVYVVISPPYGPTADFTYYPLAPKAGETVTFDASGSLPGWNGTHDVPIATYRWDFGDGNTTTVMVPIIYHTYTAITTYPVNLTVTCEDDPVLIAQGLTSASVSQDITVYSPLVPPVARFTYSPSYPSVNGTVTFNASASTPEGGTIVSYTWDFGDGNTTTVMVPIVYHTYTLEGAYIVVLNVTDSQGLWNTTSKGITIVPPKRPIIHPIEGQYANYRIYYFDVWVGQKYLVDGWDFTYDHYISPDLINVTFRYTFIPWQPAQVDPAVWMVVNITNRKVVSGFWNCTWFIGWIQTDITLGSTINIYNGVATVVGSRIINFSGYLVDCWELHQEPTGYTYYYDKLSGLLFSLEKPSSYHYYIIMLADTNIHFGVHPIASFNYSPDDPFVTEPVTLDASSSYDPDETIVSYTWDFGDGNITTVSDPVVHHRYGYAGDYNVTLTVTDPDGLTAVATAAVTVERTELNVLVDVGSIHFRGEMAEFYILVSCLGRPVNANISALLYYGDALHADLSSSVEHVATGLYRVPYNISLDASTGTYTLVAEAGYFSLNGVSMKAFLLSSTLTNWNAWLVEIHGDVATIETDIATFQISLDGINAKLQSIEGKIVTIETDLGTIKVDAELINATVIAIEGRIANIKSDLGEITVSVSDINATISAFEDSFVTIKTDLGIIKTSIDSINLTVTNINGTTVTLNTSLGDLEGTIEDIQGDIVTIKTDLGDVKVDLADVKDKLPSTPTTTLSVPVGSILSAIAAIFAIAAVILLLRRRKAPTL